jgi:GTP1/Obg family GTP-binding protein
MTIQKAGHALRDVAQIKTDYSQRMQTVQDPGQQQQLVREANGRQVQAVEAHGLSVQQYDQVMDAAQANPVVKQRLLAAAGAQ